MNKFFRKIKIRRLVISLVFALISVFVGWAIYAVVANNINSFFYDYKLTIYNHEIDKLFQTNSLQSSKVKYLYKSGELGSIYYANVDSLSNISVIESTNFEEVNLNYIQIENANEVDVSQNKTYTFMPNYTFFPYVQQALNPRKSNYLKIPFQKPYQVDYEIKNSKFYYVKGNFRVVVFGNKQNCSIVGFSEKYNNEILILKQNEKLYFMLQSATNKSLLALVNPSLIEAKEPS